MNVLAYGNLLCFHMKGSAAGNTHDSDDDVDLKKLHKIPGRTDEYDGVVNEYKETINKDDAYTDGGVEEYLSYVINDSVEESVDLKRHITVSKA